jgi:hypothetical protein
MFRRPLADVALAVLGLLPVFTQAESLGIVAQYGIKAPSGRGTFRGFGTLDGHSPAISGSSVAFGAITDRASGMYALMDGEVIVIADTLTQMPDRDLPFRFSLSQGSGPSISGRNVAFIGVVLAEGDSVWGYFNGKLRRIADTSTPAPGGIGTIRTFGSGNGIFPTISGENIAFAATWPREGPQHLGAGIYAYINGEIRRIADTNTVLPGVNRRALNFAILGGVRPSISGENVVFGAQGPNWVAIFAYIDGELRLIVDGNTPVPGREGRTFGGFGFGDGVSPDICGEKIVFSNPFLGIYTWTDGMIEMIADIDTPAPGAEGSFLFFGNANPAISGDNVSFAGRAQGTGSGIYARIDGKLRLIANEYTKVPGREDLTFAGFAQDIGVSPDISGERVVFTGVPPQGIYISCPAATGVPTLSRWGVIVTAVIILTAAAGILRFVRTRRRIRRIAA